MWWIPGVVATHVINWLWSAVSETLGWGVPAERLAWAAVELGGEVAAFGEVLA
jgi:hypothetical protein